METIHGAELVLLSFQGQGEGEYYGGILTIATPMGKNWHWLRASDYMNVDEMLIAALESAQSVGIDHINVVECQMVKEYLFVSEDDDEGIEGEIELDSEC